ncbi:MAG: hypothetical protein GWN99_01840 [Gemmatimonadetes bacterium]|uniref:Uncharacterized protein n=1 Tax=Candidatus Kutchimonas denitrificans TaxID=3056748 RepID=A0AAE4Z9V9_9BACT|nr:hypothetical protein [Gemmatimonadota bacterium]NIR74186.1 hypothetical protein [Candidatus Kutchimonas denitrificans]NIR99808.1 hypothetical protein [Gemmatimonadota bacterium]NIT65397.1 hypothetical protein [Gemmatimonadota bacterium]NIU51763.1 hypothetical protein [Gemmatimonadota bacterium]
MTRVWERLNDERGFALAMAIFALVLLAAVVAGGYFSASQEYQIGRGMRSLTTSIYAGEAGIREILDRWDPEGMATLSAGDTVTFGPVTLEGGGSYIGRVIRVGVPADSLKRYFYIEAVGRPPLPSLGERRQGLVVRARYPRFSFEAAVRAYDAITFGGKNDEIIGLDQLITAWGALCDAFAFHDTAGVNARDPLRINEPTQVVGNPAIISNYPGSSEGDIFLPEYTWSELVALADHHVANGTSFNGSTGSVVDGRCNRADPKNLGMPENTGHACFRYFPVIHVNGTATLKGGPMQGIFLAEEDFDLQGPVTVYGILMTRNDLYLSGPSEIYGFTWVADDIHYSGAVPRIYRSNCAAQRAILLSNFTRPTPVDGRAWAELF